MQYVIATLYVLLWFSLAALATLVLPRWALPPALVQRAVAYVMLRAWLTAAAGGDDGA
jgi:tRNA U34 5-methylaminomethyl-2-thiouridine-forming methyltransferase MnmC